MFERSLGVKYMHKIEIAYVNKNNAESNIHDKKGLCENANINRNFYYQNIEIKGSIQTGNILSLR